MMVPRTTMVLFDLYHGVLSGSTQRGQRFLETFLTEPHCKPTSEQVSRICGVDLELPDGETLNMILSDSKGHLDERGRYIPIIEEEIQSHGAKAGRSKRHYHLKYVVMQTGADE